jgi:ankyrin repeat protein
LIPLWPAFALLAALHARLHRAAGTDVNKALTTSGSTPLHAAAYRGQVYVVERLIAVGADVNTTTLHIATPLHLASQEGHVHVVERLLAAPGVDVNKAHRNGTTPLDIALGGGHAMVAQKLRAAGATEPPAGRLRRPAFYAFRLG